MRIIGVKSLPATGDEEGVRFGQNQRTNTDFNDWIEDGNWEVWISSSDCDDKSGRNGWAV
jgi:hypothetical protein